ncbi:glutathione S-transferase family protein [Legionella shakespearei]|uniref:Glutathione S-transferase n=1 Tax=Legionella shakespearei DSM 23087 TaxID=1122169 RepID=A0A0W0YLB9_9GAMM|nr:glutathione S-transferase C-terminal domain-containing protein [Legionella shakespearei]KTD57724.1 glutathione S-transferase [Legionella shakespearei DSM 23087]
MYTLYTYGTPNGFKPTIMLEELKEPYTIKLIDITQGEQFQPDFLSISPNNKIPVLYDASNDFYLTESVAILQYLAEKHRQFLPEALKDKYAVVQWCYFQAAHIGPMLGQFGYFHRFATEDVPFAKKRYADESLRLFGVLEKQLAKNPFTGGSVYTIADMAIWPWIWCFQTIYEQTVDAELFPNLMAWYKRVNERPAIKATLAAYGR